MRGAAASLQRLPGAVDVVGVAAGQAADDRPVDLRGRWPAPPRSRRARRWGSRPRSRPRRGRCRAWAISSFSARFMLAPGDCSPSRKVVSKMIRRFVGHGAAPLQTKKALGFRVPGPVSASSNVVSAADGVPRTSPPQGEQKVQKDQVEKSAICVPNTTVQIACIVESPAAEGNCFSRVPAPKVADFVLASSAVQWWQSLTQRRETHALARLERVTNWETVHAGWIVELHRWLKPRLPEGFRSTLATVPALVVAPVPIHPDLSVHQQPVPPVPAGSASGDLLDIAPDEK